MILKSINQPYVKKTLSLTCQNRIQPYPRSLIHVIILYNDYSWKSCKSQLRMRLELQKNSLVLFSLTSGFKISLYAIVFYWCSAL